MNTIEEDNVPSFLIKLQEGKKTAQLYILGEEQKNRIEQEIARIMKIRRINSELLYNWIEEM
jgi:hypothetical protein